MYEAVPDIVQDNITDACKRLGLKYVEQFFFKAAEAAGFSNPEDCARHRHQQWIKEGYRALPPYIQEYALQACNGEVH